MRKNEGIPMPTWLEGSWVEESDDRKSDELWTRDLQGNMAGVFRLKKGGQPRLYEFMLIERSDAGLHLWLKHFAPDLAAADKDIAFETFDCIESTASSFLCVNREASPPIAISYSLNPDGALAVRVTRKTEPEERILEFRFTKVRGEEDGRIGPQPLTRE